jgi:hypothetical protein
MGFAYASGKHHLSALGLAEPAFVVKENESENRYAKAFMVEIIGAAHPLGDDISLKTCW